jgi:hypothetical protein
MFIDSARYHSLSEDYPSFRSPNHLIHIPHGFFVKESLVLLEQLNDLSMAIFSFIFSLAPNRRLQVSVFDPTYPNGACLAVGRVRVNLNTSNCSSDTVLEPAGRSSISSRTAVLDVDLIH